MSTPGENDLHVAHSDRTVRSEDPKGAGRGLSLSSARPCPAGEPEPSAAVGRGPGAGEVWGCQPLEQACPT